MSTLKIDRVVASRELTDAKDPKKRVIVALGTPRRVSAGEWRCVVRIDGLDAKPILKSIPGADSLQALLLGIEFLRKSLRQSSRRLALSGVSALYPAGGIPRQVPDDLGEEFDNRIAKIIEREEQRYRKFRAKVLRAYRPDATKGGTTSTVEGRRRSE